MYNPILNQVGAALIERGYGAAADLKLKGAQAMADGIAAAGQSVAGGIAGAAAKWQQNAEKQSRAAGALQAFASMNDQAQANGGKPIVDPIFLQSVSKMKPDEANAALSSVAPVFESFLSTQRQLAVANAGGDFTPSVVDLGNGVRAMMTSKNSAVPVRDPGAWAIAGRKLIRGANGWMVVDPSTASAAPVVDGAGNPVGLPVTTKPDASSNLQLANVNKEITETEKALSEGQTNSGWFGWGESYSDKLRRLQKEREDVLKQRNSGTSVVVPDSSATGNYKSAEDVRAAFNSGRISRENAIKILNGMGMK